MYPNLYYAFKDLMGVDLPFLRFFNTFGFFVALAFGAAATSLSYELRQKKQARPFSPRRNYYFSRGACQFTRLNLQFYFGFSSRV